MASNFLFYIYCIVAVIIGFLIAKKIAGCLLKSIIAFITVAVLVAIYYIYFK